MQRNTLARGPPCAGFFVPREMEAGASGAVRPMAGAKGRGQERTDLSQVCLQWVDLAQVDLQRQPPVDGVPWPRLRGQPFRRPFKRLHDVPAISLKLNRVLADIPEAGRLSGEERVLAKSREDHKEPLKSNVMQVSEPLLLPTSRRHSPVNRYTSTVCR